MKKPLWIIAICTAIRCIQNGIQLHMMLSEKAQRQGIYNEFIDSLRKDNKDWARDTLKEFLDEKYEEGMEQFEKEGWQ